MSRCERVVACLSCGGPAERLELGTRPIVYECTTCSELFTRRGRTKTTTLRTIRKQIIQRWDQLGDDLWHLEQAIRNAPAGVFTPEERHEAVLELGQTAWDVMVNSRPRLPASVYGPRRGAIERFRTAVLDLAIFRRSTPEERAGVFGEVTEEQLEERVRKAREEGGNL